MDINDNYMEMIWECDGKQLHCISHLMLYVQRYDLFQIRTFMDKFM